MCGVCVESVRRVSGVCVKCMLSVCGDSVKSADNEWGVYGDCINIERGLCGMGWGDFVESV